MNLPRSGGRDSWCPRSPPSESGVSKGASPSPAASSLAANFKSFSRNRAWLSMPECVDLRSLRSDLGIVSTVKSPGSELLNFRPKEAELKPAHPAWAIQNTRKRSFYPFSVLVVVKRNTPCRSSFRHFEVARAGTRLSISWRPPELLAGPLEKTSAVQCVHKHASRATRLSLASHEDLLRQEIHSPRAPPGARLPSQPRTWIEIDPELIRMIEVIGTHCMWMQFKTA